MACLQTSLGAKHLHLQPRLLQPPRLFGGESKKMSSAQNFCRTVDGEDQDHHRYHQETFYSETDGGEHQPHHKYHHHHHRYHHKYHQLLFRNLPDCGWWTLLRRRGSSSTTRFFGYFDCFDYYCGDFYQYHIFYTQLSHITFMCPMRFNKFPFDRFAIPITIALATITIVFNTITITIIIFMCHKWW